MNAKSKKDGEFYWYVVYTHPRSEKKAANYLAEKGIEVFLPLHKILKQWSDRKKWTVLPLFPSYLFVKINKEQYLDVLNTPKVSRYIYFEGKAATISDRQIEVIRAIIQAELPVEANREVVKKGDLVEITMGALKGLKGIAIEAGSNKKVQLRFDEIDFSLIISVPANKLKVIGQTDNIKKDKGIFGSRIF
jgi:transcription antitermination factor NusG